MASIHYFPLAILFLSLVVFSKLNLCASKSSGFSLRLIPRESPESPLYPGNLTQLERIKRLVHFTNTRAELMKLRSTPNTTFDDEKYLLAIQREGFMYMAEIKIGTPPQSVFLLVDTGGSLTWTQCKPCINCYRQQNDIYDSQESYTFRTVPCDHPFCSVSNLFHCVNGECVYAIEYAGGAGPTRGFLAFESFIFQTDFKGNTITISNIIFGCSNDNPNFDRFAHNGLISGIMGLSVSPDSLFTQMFDLVNRIFSYCVVRFDEDVLMHPMVMRFGDDVMFPPEGGFQTTSYGTIPGSDLYYLNAIDISINGRRLEIPPGSFWPNWNSGFFIDSGAEFTLLSTQTPTGFKVYDRVMIALQNYFDYYHLERAYASELGLQFQLCYRYRSRFTAFPSLTFHFQGADYTIAGEHLNIKVRELRGFCVAILPRDGASALGAFHMQDMRIIYNANINAIHFYPEDCSLDQF